MRSLTKQTPPQGIKCAHIQHLQKLLIINESKESDFPFPPTAVVMLQKEPIRNQNIDVSGIHRHSINLGLSSVYHAP